MTKQNILLIYADQWRMDQFGAKTSYTPNIDALAKEAVSFNRHYTQAIPCGPARACLFTGLNVQTHGVIHNRFPLDARHKTMAQYLRRRSYEPTLFGYTDTALDPRTLEPGDPRREPGYHVLPGCEVGCHQPTDAPNDWLAHLRSKGVPFTNPDDVYDPDTSKPNPTGGAGGHPTKYEAQDSDTAYLTDRFLSWQQEQKEGWCALICYLRPHPPTIAPEPWNSKVDPAELDPPIRAKSVEEEAAIHPFMAHQMTDGKAGNKCYPGLTGAVADVEEKDWRSLRAIHLALMAELDAHVGRVIDQLKQSGQWENTLILFSSDHGEAMFDHHLCNQASWHEQCAHVPMILRLPDAWARQADGAEIDAFTGSIDTVPTLLDWLDLDIPGHLDGRSVLPFLRDGKPEDWREGISWEYHYREMAFSDLASTFNLKDRDCMMSVYRDEHFKHAYLPGQPPVLVDLQKDPDELRNVAGEPDYHDIERKYLALQLQNRIRHAERQLDPYLNA